MKLSRSIFKIKNLNLSKTISFLAKNSIVCYNVILDKKLAIFEINQVDCKATINLLKKLNIEYQVQNQHNILFWKNMIFSNFGIILGLIFSLVAIMLTSQICLKYEVVCDNVQTKHEINKILKENQIKFKFIDTINTQELNDNICKALPNVAFSQSYFVGGKLVIETIPQHVDNEPIKQYSSIIASDDCVIERVDLWGGTALVKAGDIVKKGQEVIAGYIQIGDPNDPNSTKQSCEAKGEVYAKLWKYSKLDLPLQKVQMVYTGNMIKTNDMLIFGKIWGGKNKNEFSYYSKSIKHNVFYNAFPLQINTTTYYEMSPKEIVLSEEEIQKEIFEEKNRILNSLKEQNLACTNWKLYKRVDNLCHIDIYYELIANIGQGVI